MEVFIETVENGIVKLDVPYTPRERTFEQFCEFQNHEQKYLRLTAKEGYDLEEVIRSVTAAVGCLVEGDVDKLEFRIDGDRMDNLFNENWVLTPNAEISVMRLYVHLFNAFNSYQPLAMPTSWKYENGEVVYTCDGSKVARLLGGGRLTTGETLEMLEFQRRYKKKGDDKKLGTGNMDFGLGLTQLAILCRKEGEPFPSERNKIDDFIKARREELKGVPLHIIFDLRFFLISSLRGYLTTRTINTSLNKNRRRAAQGMPRRKPKRRR